MSNAIKSFIIITIITLCGSLSAEVTSRKGDLYSIIDLWAKGSENLTLEIIEDYADLQVNAIRMGKLPSDDDQECILEGIFNYKFAIPVFVREKYTLKPFFMNKWWQKVKGKVQVMGRNQQEPDEDQQKLKVFLLGAWSILLKLDTAGSKVASDFIRLLGVPREKIKKIIEEYKEELKITEADIL